MENSTASVMALGIIVLGVILGVAIQVGHEDNNREKQLVTVCIQSGGEPIYENRNESMRGCDRP